MKSIPVGAVMAFLAAGTAQAGLITWSYGQDVLRYDRVGSYLAGAYPYPIPGSAGPLRFSFALDPDDFPDLGHAPVVLTSLGYIEFAETALSIQNIEVTGNAGDFPSDGYLGETWDFFDYTRIEIGTDGEISSWYVSMYPQGRNSTLGFSDSFETFINFYRTDFDTYAGTIRYRVPGRNAWTRTGGEDIFPARVPLPAGGVMLAGGLTGLLVLARARKRACAARG